MLTKDTFLKVAQLSYPNGRAFNMPVSQDDIYCTEDGAELYTTEDGDPIGSGSTGGILYRLHRALALSYASVFDALRNINNSLLADNPFFTVEDAEIWERRLGIITVPGAALPSRMDAIRQKYNYPGAEKYRQHAAFVEAQLRAAGYDVHIYENRFPDGSGGYEAESPSDVLGIPVGDAVLDKFELDELELDSRWADDGITISANYIDEAKDALFDISNYRSTFFIAGATISTFADVPAILKDQFRQLILQLKRQHAVAILFVNYTT